MADCSLLHTSVVHCPLTSRPVSSAPTELAVRPDGQGRSDTERSMSTSVHEQGLMANVLPHPPDYTRLSTRASLACWCHLGSLLMLNTKTTTLIHLPLEFT